MAGADITDRIRALDMAYIMGGPQEILDDFLSVLGPEAKAATSLVDVDR